MHGHIDKNFDSELDDGIWALPRSPGHYLIFNRFSGMVYVGQSLRNVQRRCGKHRTDLKAGIEVNRLLQRAWDKDGPDALFYLAVNLDVPEAMEASDYKFRKVEIYLARQLLAHDERHGYNSEAGHLRTWAARFRERERKMMRHHKYELLPYVEMGDPIVNQDLLRSWVPGC